MIMIKKIIKIPGKSFNDLAPAEVALMIEADSSLAGLGNDSFSSCALDEFLYSNEVNRRDLLILRNYILERIYLDSPGSKHKEVDSDFLRALARRIRSSGSLDFLEAGR